MKKLLFIINNLNNKNFILSSSIIVITASMAGNVFAYVFQVLSGRYLSVADYGKLTALFSLSGILPLIISLILGALPKLVAEIKDINYPNRISHLFFTLLYFSAASFTIITSLLLIFQKQIANYLNIDDLPLIQSFSFAVGAGILIAFLAPFLQGLLRFKAFSFIGILTAFLKLAVILIIIIMQLGPQALALGQGELTNGVTQIFIGLTITTLIAGLISLLLLRKNLVLTSGKLDYQDFKTLIRYSIFSALGLAGLNIMQNIDLIVAKHLFDETTAGLYGSTTVIGKIIFYAASPIAIVILPICSQKFKNGQNFVKPFLTSIGIGLFVSLSGLMVYTFFPELAIKILFGQNYLGVVQYLPLYSVYMVVFTLMNFLTMFLISISKFKLSILPLFAALFQFIGIQFFANSINDIIIYSIWASIFVTVPLGIFVTKIALENKHTQD
jgi:O-antigen/teichoic acid export membrane protein